MIRKLFSLGAIVAVIMLTVALPSCGFNQHLISIQVTPNPVVFQGIGATVQFTALGTYDHPPATKDITSQVQWRIDISYLATINSAGVAVATGVCGAGNAIATVYSDPSSPSSGTAVVGSAAISGIDQGQPQCQ
jgi:hypothetical protein